MKTLLVLICGFVAVLSLTPLNRKVQALPRSLTTIDEIIVFESEQAGFDPILTKAIILTESSGNPKAKRYETALKDKFKSKDMITARGLMQVVPAYHLETCGIATSKQLEDPQTNVRCGLKYLRTCFDKYKNEQSKTKRFQKGINCYNAGILQAPKYVKKVEYHLRKLQGLS